ncbi:hypothetical protein HAZT_HAZT005423 [Hyalella azteca]|uniref:Uncharacterized protein LOC108668938 n=1 Tax=Hyalella azteca TaxID=294128 RepID=A0A6A0H746_HYAAZ|nr:uncharacterized protein LOC108668938 [Hyalella azteca]KAA0201532.1 hypothetical protein HAZT_HAZT005423 [Hyalella azteca]
MEGSNAGIGQISNVVALGNNTIALNGANLTNLTAMPAGTVTVPVSGMHTVQGVPVAFYNYTPEGMGQLVATTGQTVQLELAGNTDIARQFNQQVQAQYGTHIQLQLVPAQLPTMQPQQVQQTQQVIPLQIQQSHTVQHIAQPQQHQPQQVTVQQIQQTVKIDDDAGNYPSVSNPVENASETAKKKNTKPVGSDRVPCPMCPKTVSCSATLRDHMRTHTGERPFSCSECGLAFSQRSNLRMHKRLHTGERPYMCGICGKTFARSSHLPAHMRTHTGEKPYVCTSCDHAFITAQQLKNHNRVHTGEKPWRCDLCPAAFTHSSSLSTHKKKHTGNKPFECDKCTKKFFFTSALDKHLKVHSKARPFICPTCENTFKYKESLTVHMERYCGRQSEKKQRAPRKPDAKKPGPKPGAGRKYVQQRKGRPRGRPRKRGRQKKVVKKQQPQQPKVVSTESPVSEIYGMKNDNEDEDDGEKVGSIMFHTDSDDDIPVAELKVEKIEGTNETHVVVESVSGDRNDGIVSSSAVHNEMSHADAMHVSVAHSSGIHQVGDLGSSIVQFDPSTVTIVSAEEAERHLANSNLQIMTLQPEMLQLMQQGAQPGHIISSDVLHNASQIQISQVQTLQNNIHIDQHQDVAQHQMHIQHQHHHQPQQHATNHTSMGSNHQMQQQQQHHHQQQQQQNIVMSNQCNGVPSDIVVKNGLQVYYTR